MYFHTIWINDIENKAWYKRVLPQNITCACVFNDKILTADDIGNVYMEDIGNSFDGKPINFMWKSPFLSLGNPSVRKSIDEFYHDGSFAHSNDMIIRIKKINDEQLLRLINFDDE